MLNRRFDGAGMDSLEIKRWKKAVAQLTPRNRVHVCQDMSACYRELAEIYSGCRILGVASGEKSGSWTAPPAWEVEGARLTGPDGTVIADWHQQPLSLYTYSPSVETTIDRDALQAHLMSIPDLPERTPFHFRNQYRHWAPEWGFSIPQAVRDRLPQGRYNVNIRTRFEPGQMEMVEQTLPGEYADSILFVGHFDHPYMALDGLIGCIAGHEIVSRLARQKRKLTYRMLSTVEIIGSVFYAERWAQEAKVREATFVATAGADAPIRYQTSFSGTSVTDRAMRHILSVAYPDAGIDAFRRGALGNDETAFDVSTVGIPCGSIMRAPFGEYHTDVDTAAAVVEAKMEEMIALVLRTVGVIENNAVIEPRFTGLPCLSSPELDLYISGVMMSQQAQAMSPAARRFVEMLSDAPRAETIARPVELAYLMNMLPAAIDGKTTTLDIAEKTGLPFEAVDVYTNLWEEKDLVKKTWQHPFRSAQRPDRNMRFDPHSLIADRFDQALTSGPKRTVRAARSG
jgi:aminopeptidase-like protein